MSAARKASPAPGSRLDDIAAVAVAELAHGAMLGAVLALLLFAVVGERPQPAPPVKPRPAACEHDLHGHCRAVLMTAAAAEARS